MGEIRRLASGVIDRIAAGEVIERPASVAKELVENAIDAGAGRIELLAEAGGLERVCVSDDGSGMSPEDARLALERHATSKIREAEDLFRIRTLGFRGEALSSVAAVSRLTLTTRRPGDAEARRLVIEGGERLADEPVGAPVGTTIDVRDLFFNTPARRKFMRAPATEQAHLVDAAVHCVISAPRVGLVVHSGVRRVVDVPADSGEPGRAAARAAAALRQRTDLFAFSAPASDAGIRVHGFLAAPERARGDGKGMWTLVNRRFVRDRTLRAAVLDAFGGILEKRRYPVCVVEVEIDPEAVDVNVHPQKLEVRFADASALYRAVHVALTQALAHSPWLVGQQGAVVPPPLASTLARDGRVPYFGTQAAGGWPAGADGGAAGPALGFGAAAPPGSGSLSGSGAGGPSDAVPVWLGSFASPSRGMPAGAVGTIAGGAPPDTPVPVGEVGRFVLCQSRRGWLVVDRAAAAERVCVQRLEAEQRAGEITRRELLFPEPLEPTAPVDGWLEANWESLRPLGFEVEPVGPGRFAVRAVPAALPRDVNVRPLVLDLLETLVTFHGPTHERDALLFARYAEHASRRPLTAAATVELLAALWALGPAMESLDGEPIVRPLTEAELARVFKG